MEGHSKHFTDRCCCSGDKGLPPRACPYWQSGERPLWREDRDYPDGGYTRGFSQCALELKLEAQHDTDILVTTEMGKGDEMLLPDREQFNANYLAQLGLEIAQRIGRENAYIIVLTNEDINNPEQGCGTSILHTMAMYLSFHSQESTTGILAWYRDLSVFLRCSSKCRREH